MTNEFNQFYNKKIKDLLIYHMTSYFYISRDELNHWCYSYRLES